MTDAETITPPTPAPLPKKRGCFFYGCITSLILMLVVAVGLLFVARYVLNCISIRLVAPILRYQAGVSAHGGTAARGDEGLAGAHHGFFSDAQDAHSNAAPLILTGNQVNALLAARPELARYKGQFFVSFDGTQTKAQISLPLETLPKLP